MFVVCGTVWYCINVRLDRMKGQGMDVMVVGKMGSIG